MTNTIESQLVITLFTLLFVKHFLVDFLLQTKYQWSNKHKLGHPGGILHVFLHIAATVLVIGDYVPNMEVMGIVLLFEAVAHYFIDWAKMNISMKYELDPTKHAIWFHLLGLDQLLHYLTYSAMIYYALILN